MKANNSEIKFISYKKIKLPTVKKLFDEKRMEWRRGEGGREEEWIFNRESVISSIIGLSSLDFSFSDKNDVEETNGRISNKLWF